MLLVITFFVITFGVNRRSCVLRWATESRTRSWTVEAVQNCTCLFQVFFASSWIERVRTARLSVALPASFPHCAYILNETHVLYCLRREDRQHCTVLSVLALLKRSKQVPLRELRLAFLSQSVQIRSDPHTANQLIRIESIPPRDRRVGKIYIRHGFMKRKIDRYQ